MMGFFVDSSGLDQGAIDRINAFVGEVTEAELESAARFGADLVRAIAPIDTGAYRYGQPPTSASGTPVANGITHKQMGELQWAYGTPAPYGRALEMGHPITGAPAQPHFGPSMPVVGDFFIGNMLARGFVRG